MSEQEVWTFITEGTFFDRSKKSAAWDPQNAWGGGLQSTTLSECRLYSGQWHHEGYKES